MRIGKLLLYAVMPMMSLAVSAQEKNPQQGDFTVALTLGYNSSVMQNAAAGNKTNYNLQAASTNWNDKALTVGIEGGWFFRDLWKLNLGGGMNITKAPGYGPIPGTIDDTYEPGDGSIPNYGGPLGDTVPSVHRCGPLLPHKGRRPFALRGSSRWLRLRS